MWLIHLFLDGVIQQSAIIIIIIIIVSIKSKNWFEFSDLFFSNGHFSSIFVVSIFVHYVSCVCFLLQFSSI
jgi:hypothetical protein